MDVLTGKPLMALAFYPPVAPGDGDGTQLGPYRVEGEFGLPLAAGKHPLVLISHGHLGSQLGHHDLAEQLARAGYIAAAVKHSGDSFDDDSAFGTDRAMLGRAYQVSALLDAVLADPVLGPQVDTNRIGVAGFSAGGYTSLLVVGARPDFSLISEYCQRYPKDPEICSIHELKRTISNPKPTVDPRVKAAFVMAPFAVCFGPGSFDEVRAPVFLAWGGKDAVLLPEEHAARVKRHLKTLAGTKEFPAAGHYVFLSCSPGMVSDAPDLCQDPAGVDRAQVHREVNAGARAFFDRTL